MAIAVQFAVSLAAFLVEGDELGTAEVIFVLQSDFGTVNLGRADLEFGAIGDGENFVDGDGGTLFGVKEFDIETVAGLDAVLLAAGFDDCVCLHEAVPRRWILGEGWESGCAGGRSRRRVSTREN